MHRNDFIDKTNALRKRAKQIHDLLSAGKIAAQDIPSYIRQADKDYLTITTLIIKWHAQFAFFEIDCDAQIRKATSAYNSLFDPKYTKPLDEITAMTDIENSSCGGVLSQFRPYLHDKIKYINRVREYLDELNLRLNGYSQDGFMSFVKVHESRSTLVTELRLLTSKLQSLNDDAVLKVFEKVSGKIASANLDDMERHEKCFIAAQKKSLTNFNFKHSKLNATNGSKLV